MREGKEIARRGLKAAATESTSCEFSCSLLRERLCAVMVMMVFFFFFVLGANGLRATTLCGC